RPGEAAREDLQLRDRGEVRPAPPQRGPRPALAADLVEEEPIRSADHSVVVRLRDAAATVEQERDQAPFGDPGADPILHLVGRPPRTRRHTPNVREISPSE